MPGELENNMKNNIWVTSDSHFGHENISNPHTSKWKEGFRNFKNLQEHDETIVKNINKLVAEDDILYHLGDWSFGGIQNIWNFRKQLRCKNIHLILGNHDHHIEENKQLKIPEADRERLLELNIPEDVYKRFNGFSHVPAMDLFARVNHVLTINHNGYTIFMSHYAHRVWLGSHKGFLHFYGHSHDSICEWGKSIDVGIDSAYRYFGEYRPFTMEEAIKIADAREIEFPDHHNPKTNVR